MSQSADEYDVLETAPGEEYAGWAVVSTDGDDPSAESVVIEVSLRGHFEPLDGRFHWYGRIAANEQLAERVRSGQSVVLTTKRGSAAGRVSDVDPWGRFRIAGQGRPPF